PQATWCGRCAGSRGGVVSDSVHVAFDLGAESGRAIIGRFRDDRLALTEVARFPTRSACLPDGLYWDALGLFGEVTSALGPMRASGARASAEPRRSWPCPTCSRTG